MVRKTVDHPRKTTQNGCKRWHSWANGGQCYKSFRQNGDVFRRNYAMSKDLELLSGCVVFKCNLCDDLRLKTVDGPRCVFRNRLSRNGFRRSLNFSPAGEVQQGITIPLLPARDLHRLFGLHGLVAQRVGVEAELEPGLRGRLGLEGDGIDHVAVSRDGLGVE